MIAFLALLPLLGAVSAMPTKRADGQQIHINGDATKCLSVEKLEDGSPVVNTACNNGWHNGWTIVNGNNENGIRITGTNFCLDAGDNPSDFSKAKIWTCYKGLTQQTWWYTDDKHLAITGGNQCLDVGQANVQTYQCIGYNTNQIWTVSGGGSSPSSSASPTASPSASASSSASASASESASASASSSSGQPPAPTGAQIHFKGSSTGCLTVNNGQAAVGQSVVIAPCAGPNDANLLALQRFNIKRNTAGPITLASKPELCLDASTDGATTDGSAIKVWTCYEGLSQQQWYYTDDNHLAVVDGNQCLNVRKESGPVPNKPYGTLQTLQTWSCSGNDPQQIFTV